MKYMCMLCVAYIKAEILFALEEQSIVKMVFNSLSFNFFAWTFFLFTVSFSCYT